MNSEAEVTECCEVPMSVETAPWDWQHFTARMWHCYGCGHCEPFDEEP
ncbi:hypothetical protein ACWIGW_38690 [Nocardia brasiliensis]